MLKCWMQAGKAIGKKSAAEECRTDDIESVEVFSKVRLIHKGLEKKSQKENQKTLKHKTYL